MDTDNIKEAPGLPGGIPALWSRFRDAVGDEYFHCWLALQAALLGAAAQGLLVMAENDTDAFAPVARWPEGTCDHERLTDICEGVLEQRCPLLRKLPPAPAAANAPPSYAIAYPILIDRTLHGVAALEIVAASEAELGDCLAKLQWGVAWLELACRRRQQAEEATQLSAMKASFDLLAMVLAEGRFSAASQTFVTALSTLMQCDRVSLGLVRERHVRLVAMSHSANFSQQMNLVRRICGAMEEAILQGCEMLYPLPTGGKVLVTREHQELARHQADESILTIPLHGGARYAGALTLERPAELPFQQDEVMVCRGIVALVAPILEEKRQNDRCLLAKAVDSLSTQLARLFGAGFIGRKVVSVLLLALAVFFSQATGDYRLTASTTLEPLVRRSIVSPFNGYVKEAAARSGDVVTQGTVLCRLDDRDLHLERDKWLNQQTQYQRQRQEAIASNDRAKANIIAAQLDQVTAQLDLVQAQLKRTSLLAPFDGVVVSGDLSQRIDGSVEQGEVLFELAPLNAYRVILQVDEYRIADVRPGQRGALVLPALLDRNFDFEVEKITPISTQKEGRNTFRVEAKLLATSDVLRPGMEGIGKIWVDRRALLAIGTRDLLDWLRLKVWYWWP